MSLPFIATVLLVVLTIRPVAATAGSLSGQVLVNKKLTKKALSSSTYSLRGAAVPLAPADPDSATEYGRMVVLLEGGPPAQTQPLTAVLNQRGQRFAPGLLVVPVGSTVVFPNEDPIFHNIFSLSKTKQFDLGYYPQGQSRAVRFERNGVVQVYCHIHPSMYAAIVVTDSPWHARPAEDGSFGWDGIPGGMYQLVAWHNIAGFFRQDVHVPDTGQVTVVVRIPVEASRP